MNELLHEEILISVIEKFAGENASHINHKIVIVLEIQWNCVLVRKPVKYREYMRMKQSIYCCTLCCATKEAHV